MKVNELREIIKKYKEFKNKVQIFLKFYTKGK